MHYIGFPGQIQVRVIFVNLTFLWFNAKLQNIHLRQIAFRLKHPIDKVDADDIRSFRKSAILKAKKQVKSKNMNKFIERDFL